jgi:hypothetical protein
MPDIVINVDTTPLARTVDSVSGHVRGTAAAVTAMEAAVIATEKESSRELCKNINSGFFSMIKYQISQKLVAAKTSMDAKLITLNQYNKALDSLKNQMESDYHMIARRYLKLFHSLDKVLETRINELDKPVMNLAEIKKSIVFSRYRDSGSTVIGAAEETVMITQQALAARLKQKTAFAMDTMETTVNQTQSYNNQLDSILEERQSGVSKEGAVYLPVIFSETESFVRQDETLETLYTGGQMPPGNEAAITASVMGLKDTYNWNPVGIDEKDAVAKEFNALCEQQISDERLAGQIRELFEKSGGWDALKGEGHGVQ